MSQEPSIQDPLKELLQQAVAGFTSANKAGRVVSQGLKVVGTGMLPVIDYLCFLSAGDESCIAPFLAAGYGESSAEISVSEGTGRVFQKDGYPALVLVTAAADDSESFIQAWTAKYGSSLFMLALKVENIENAVFYLEKQGIPFADMICGRRGDALRFAVSSSECGQSPVPSALVLVERLKNYRGFRIALPSLKASSPR